MKKRVAVAALWFSSISMAGGFAEALFGVPADIGGFLGIAAAVMVVVDPTGHVWAKRQRRMPQFSSVA